MSTVQPQMRGLLRRRIIRDVLTSVGLALIVAGTWWFGVAKPRKQKYLNFYKGYDANAEAEKLKASWEE